MVDGWIPDRGDLVWMNFSPQSGREQAGHRPALTLTTRAYNRMAGVALFCPVRSRAKGWSFEVPLPLGLGIEGVILADQIRSIDWVSRRARLAGRAPYQVVEEVLGKAATLLT